MASFIGAVSEDRHLFQLWYRDVAGPCNTGFNTTSAIDLTWD